jgi:two-component system cell cycle response regulator
MSARILVVEDNKDNVILIDYLLRARGYEPSLARNGPDGLRIAELERPDLILLDIRMEGMDGYEVAAKIRAHPEMKETQLVAVTASAMVGDRERIAAAGFDHYIQKPIEPSTFVDTVERFLAL